MVKRDVKFRVVSIISGSERVKKKDGTEVIVDEFNEIARRLDKNKANDVFTIQIKKDKATKAGVILWNRARKARKDDFIISLVMDRESLRGERWGLINLKNLSLNYPGLKIKEMPKFTGGGFMFKRWLANEDENLMKKDELKNPTNGRDLNLAIIHYKNNDIVKEVFDEFAEDVQEGEIIINQQLIGKLEQGDEVIVTINQTKYNGKIHQLIEGEQAIVQLQIQNSLTDYTTSLDNIKLVNKKGPEFKIINPKQTIKEKMDEKAKEEEKKKREFNTFWGFIKSLFKIFDPRNLIKLIKIVAKPITFPLKKIRKEENREIGYYKGKEMGCVGFMNDEEPLIHVILWQQERALKDQYFFLILARNERGLGTEIKDSALEEIAARTGIPLLEWGKLKGALYLGRRGILHEINNAGKKSAYARYILELKYIESLYKEMDEKKTEKFIEEAMKVIKAPEAFKEKKILKEVIEELTEEYEDKMKTMLKKNTDHYKDELNKSLNEPNKSIDAFGKKEVKRLVRLQALLQEHERIKELIKKTTGMEVTEELDIKSKLPTTLKTN